MIYSTECAAVLLMLLLCIVQAVAYYCMALVASILLYWHKCNDECALVVVRVVELHVLKDSLYSRLLWQVQCSSNIGSHMKVKCVC